MKILKATTASLMLAALPLAAQSEDLSYSFVSLDYVETEIDGIGPNADGFAARGSVGFAERFFAFAEYADQSVVNLDIQQIAVGFGGHYGLTDNLDLVGRAGWVRLEFSSGGLNADDDGYLVSAGLRTRIAEQVELEGSVIQTDFGGGGSGDTAFDVAGRYHFNTNFSLSAEYRHSDDASVILAGVRFNF
jgi:hypothetical protein